MQLPTPVPELDARRTEPALVRECPLRVTTCLSFKPSPDLPLYRPLRSCLINQYPGGWLHLFNRNRIGLSIVHSINTSGRLHWRSLRLSFEYTPARPPTTHAPEAFLWITLPLRPTSRAIGVCGRPLKLPSGKTFANEPSSSVPAQSRLAVGTL